MIKMEKKMMFLSESRHRFSNYITQDRNECDKRKNTKIRRKNS
jgi:hypothetical protein